MIVFPTAKINFGLSVTGKRPDGYHNIDTIFYPVKFCDALEYVRSDISEDRLVTTGFATGCNPEDNLVNKMLKTLRKRYDLPPLKIHLHKAIPIGAGLAGGSSDAVCLLKALNRSYNLGLTRADMKAISLEIGSDCPFFVDNVPAQATGRGEILTPVRSFLEGYYIVLLNPGQGISTREAYSNCRISVKGAALHDLIESPPATWKETIRNDFESYAIEKNPLIGKLKEALYQKGAIFSLMTGSGSTVFGLFAEKPSLAGTKQYIIYQGSL